MSGEIEDLVREAEEPPQKKSACRGRVAKASSKQTTLFGTVAEDPVKQRSHEVVSVSRRTDVPTMHMGDILRTIESGSTTVANPRNPSQVSKVPLTPDRVKCFAWWSKNYGHFKELYETDEHVRELLGKYVHIFNFTINSPCELEPGMYKVPLEQRLTRDHIVPKSLGGSDGDDNIILVCGWCNQSKGNLMLEDWLYTLPIWMPQHYFARIILYHFSSF